MNLDIYPLMCHILGIEPAPNNGSFDRVRSILKNNGDLNGKVKKFERNRAFVNAQMPPWVPEKATGAKLTKECGVKVATHYLPFSYSVNFDIIVMTLLLFVYVAIMIGLSERLRRNRHRQLQTEESKMPIQPTKKENTEKCLIIDVVA